jgi:uracil-DNA glycosylase
MPAPLSELVGPGWPTALAPVADRITEMGQFLRAELAAGRP